MMNTNLPRYIDPVHMARVGTHLSGKLLVKDCHRLVSMIADSSGDIQIDLTFGSDAENIEYVHGFVKAVVQMLCQRCLDMMSVNIASEFFLSPVYNDIEARHLPKRYEPLMLQAKNEIELLNVIEEEIILSLPLIVKHQAGSCHIKLTEIDQNQETNNLMRDDNPFAVLRVLKSGKPKKH